MLKMYKSLMGWKEEDDKHTSTHVLLENEEYDNLLDTINFLKKAINLDKIQHEKDIETIKQKAEKDIEALENVHKLTVENLSSIAEHEKSLNVYLKKILREKSNAARKLSPRHDREGYIVLYSREVDYQYNDKTGHRKTMKVWKSMIQTMYDCGIPLRVCQNELFEGFKKLAKACGIQVFHPDIKLNEPLNQCFKLKYIANQDSRLWEIEIFHSQELEIPEEYRKPHKSKNRAGGN